MNYNKLSESKQDLLDEKYNCILCSVIIKNENPYICYICQKIYHDKCLKDWDKRCKSQNKNLLCPNCRNELSIEKWNKKLDYEDIRKDHANLMNKLNEYILINNMNNNINVIKDKKINELKDYKIKFERAKELFRNLLNKVNFLVSLFKLKENNKSNYLININSKDFNNLDVDDISNIINIKLDKLNNYIRNGNIININKKNNNNINIKAESSLSKEDEYKNNIDLIYFSNSKENCNIFGKKFVKNNKDNIEFIINGTKQKEIQSNYELKEGENIITLIIKNKLVNLSYMFYKCYSLNNISELKYLDVKDLKDFSYMFYGCSQLSNVNSLKNWSVSNCKTFECMFYGCSLLSNIKSLEKWNVSNCNNFSYMFSKCSLLIDAKPLEKWNVSNGNNFNNMFWKCSSILDLNPLQNWNVPEEELKSEI